MDSKSGFTLVEIMIVVAIIALLAAISLPNLMRSRLNANEATAQAQLKTLAQACESYRAVQNPTNYPPALADLVTSNPSYISPALDTATSGIAKNGYFYDYVRLNQAQYVCSARPEAYHASGTRTFAINETGVVRGRDNGGAAVNSTAGYNAMTVTQ